MIDKNVLVGGLVFAVLIALFLLQLRKSKETKTIEKDVADILNSSSDIQKVVREEIPHYLKQHDLPIKGPVHAHGEGGMITAIYFFTSTSRYDFKHENGSWLAAS
jgi:hypothetical protein